MAKREVIAATIYERAFDCQFAETAGAERELWLAVADSVIKELLPVDDFGKPLMLGKQEYEISERVSKLPYIKQQRYTNKGEERFVALADALSAISDTFVPKASICKCPYAKDQSQQYHASGSVGCRPPRPRI